MTKREGQRRLDERQREMAQRLCAEARETVEQSRQLRAAIQDQMRRNRDLNGLEPANWNEKPTEE